MAKQVWDKTNGGGGVYEGGPPVAETVDGHTSAVERFTDDGGVLVPMTAELALKVLGVSKAPRSDQIKAILASKERLSREAFEALKGAGYPVPAGVL